MLAGMILLFTDFGRDDLYVGQLHAACAAGAPGIQVVDLFHNVPAWNIRAGAYLLAALTHAIPRGAVVVGVVDPGVGSDRAAVVLEADGRTYVGPDNGLLSLVARRADVATSHLIRWVPETLSASFHGRDLFAPVACALARGGRPELVRAPLAVAGTDWPDDLAEVIYIDHYGNAITGVRAAMLDSKAGVSCRGRVLSRQRTFADAAPGEAFWYQNSLGLVEIAVNQGRAAEVLGLATGDAVEIGD
jgi:S-adenosylmethionine hydrolase